MYVDVDGGQKGLKELESLNTDNLRALILGLRLFKHLFYIFRARRRGFIRIELACCVELLLEEEVALQSIYLTLQKHSSSEDKTRSILQGISVIHII